MKNDQDIKECILYIINKYADDDSKKKRYLKEVVESKSPPVRGIFSEMKADGVKICGDEDISIVKDIFYYFG
jgi:hypothetical protein